MLRKKWKAKFYHFEDKGKVHIYGVVSLVIHRITVFNSFFLILFFNSFFSYIFYIQINN